MGEYVHPSSLEWLREAVPWHRRPELQPVSFAELVLAHYLRQLAVYQNRSYGGPEEEAYQSKLRAFQAQHGRIVDAYWCTSEPSAVAVTERVRRSWRKLGLPDQMIVFHSETDWVTGSSPPIADQVYACKALAVKVAEVLRGTSELVAMQWLVSAVERLLGLVDQADDTLADDVVARVVAGNEVELKSIERYYEKSAESQARLVYFDGMMRGAVALAFLIGLVGLVLYLAHFDRWHSSVTQALFLATGMGGVGAIISVMSRMAGKGAFSIDHEVGRKMVRRLGSLRPFIGATFAVAIYFGLQSKLFQFGTVARTIYFYAAVSFLAGFSERWARVMLDSAGGSPKRHDEAAK
jgi:hypothetical protein